MTFDADYTDDTPPVPAAPVVPPKPVLVETLGEAVAAIRQRNAEREIPRAILDIIQGTYTDQGCLIWWETPNRSLGGVSPKQAYGLGPVAVLRLAERLEGGHV